MINFDYNEFILNGFYKTTYSDIDTIPISSVNFDISKDEGVSYPSETPDEFKASINEFKQQLHDALMETFNVVNIVERVSSHLSMNKAGVWNGTEPSSTIWHNDYKEGGTMFALLYFDSMPQDGSGGATFYVTNNDGNYDCHAPHNNEIFQLIPQRGDVVFITHDRNVDHRVDFATIKPRRVMSTAIDCQF